MGREWEARTEETDEMLTILPLPEGLRRGYASWLRWKQDSKLVIIKLEHSSGVSSTAGFRMLSLPSKRAHTLPASASLSARTDTSQTETVTARPLAVHSSRQLFRSASFRAQVCTLAPKLANSSTTARLQTW
uniref:Uncharacterized protein n=1 Tax=Leersia perrieri TaxID=77586 RepID=A0A0D9XRS5_9ORYZ